jgi:hypothetical protein
MIAQQSKIKLLKVASLIMLALAIGSLTVNFANVYSESSGLIPVIINKGFITALCTAIALVVYRFQMKKEKDDEFIPTISTARLKSAANIFSIVILYVAGLFELYYQFHLRFTGVQLHAVYTQTYTYAFAIVLLYLFRKSRDYPLMKTVLTTLCLGIFIFNLYSNLDVSDFLLSEGKNKGFFTAHWASSLMLLWLLADFTYTIFKKSKPEPEYNPDFAWISLPAIVFLLSTEMYFIMYWTNYIRQEDAQWWNNLYYKAGLSILWSICSFVFMWLGMQYSIRSLRIISLTLFTITLAKLFVYDIKNIPPGGKIAAFILLGCLLLVVSFMYQRLKKIIIDNKAEEKKE